MPWPARRPARRGPASRRSSASRRRRPLPGRCSRPGLARARDRRAAWRRRSRRCADRHSARRISAQEGIRLVDQQDRLDADAARRPLQAAGVERGRVAVARAQDREAGAASGSPPVSRSTRWSSSRRRCDARSRPSSRRAVIAADPRPPSAPLARARPGRRAARRSRRRRPAAAARRRGARAG